MTDIKAEIGAANGRFMDAFRRGDATAIANLYTGDAQLLPANSDFVRGTTAIRAFWESVIAMGLADASLETAEIDAHGDTVIEVGRYQLMAPANIVADAGKYLVVWRRDGGTWKLHRDIWTTSQPTAARV